MDGLKGREQKLIISRRKKKGEAVLVSGPCPRD